MRLKSLNLLNDKIRAQHKAEQNESSIIFAKNYFIITKVFNFSQC